MALPIRWRLLLGEEWHSTEQTVPVVDPYTGLVAAQAPLGGPVELERALGAAHAAFAGTRRRAPHERAELLQAVARGIRERGREFADLIVMESGKPVAAAETEVERAVWTFQIAGEEARRPEGEVLAPDAVPQGVLHTGWTRRFPLGVIAALTPFNFPLNLVAHKVAPALATGNTVVLKPSPKTPLTALLLGEVLQAAGMPPGQVNVVTCRNEEVSLLLNDPRVRKLSFTGSPAVGWELKSRAGARRITLELGGNAAVLLNQDAEFEAAVPGIATAAFGLAGQSCISVQRILVHASIAERFRALLLEHTLNRVRTGDPRDRATLVGPMIDPAATARAEALIQDAIQKGARLLSGGNRRGPCLEPTLLENVPRTARLAHEEAFAPVATIETFSEFSEGLALINESPFGLQAGVFTQNLELALQAFETLDVGAVLINQVPTWRVEHLPYGGIKQSGYGREGIRSAMREMTEERALIIKRKPLPETFSP